MFCTIALMFDITPFLGVVFEAISFPEEPSAWCLFYAVRRSAKISQVKTNVLLFTICTCCCEKGSWSGGREYRNLAAVLAPLSVVLLWTKSSAWSVGGGNPWVARDLFLLPSGRYILYPLPSLTALGGSS